MQMNKNSILIIVAILAVVVTGVLIYFNSNPATDNVLSFLQFNSKSADSAIAKKAIDYINQNGLAGQGQTVTLVSVSEQSGLVKMSVKVGTNSFDSYVTKDGSLLFPTSIPLTGTTAQANANSQTPPAGSQTVDISKVNITGEPYTGNVNAPVVMAFWSDYQCPFCKKVEQEIIPQLVKDYVDTGKLKIVFKDYPFLGVDSQTLAKFSRAVWQVAPAKFYAWNKNMYDNQGTENTGWATQSEIMKLTTSVLGAGDAAKVLALEQSNSDQYQKLLDADKAEGVSFGIQGTPGTIIGKKLISGADVYSSFSGAIDAVLNGK